MKTSEKRMILILLIIVIIAIIIFALTRKNDKVEKVEENNIVENEFIEVLEDGTKLNTSTKLSEKKKIQGLEIGNIQLTNNNNQTILLADVTNNSGRESELMLLDIILLDKNGNELGTVAGIIGPLKSGESTQFNTSMMIDYSNAYDFKIIKK